MRRRRLILAGASLLTLVTLAAGVWLSLARSGPHRTQWAAPAVVVPVISTRGTLDNGQPLAGHAAMEYQVEGELPGWNGAAAPDDLLIVVHGFNNTVEKARYKFAIAQEALDGAGYRGALAGFSWDADTQHDLLAATGYHEGKRNAVANGVKLARFIRDYRQRNPATRIHLVGYSMGARLALEALLVLEQSAPPGVPPLASVHLVGAAVGNAEVETGQRYGGAISHQTGILYNYYSREDNKLGAYFPVKELDRALGETDIEHPEFKPVNYISVDAAAELPKFNAQGAIEADEYGDNHSGYLGTRDESGRLIDDGVMDLIAAQILELGKQ